MSFNFNYFMTFELSFFMEFLQIFIIYYTAIDLADLNGHQQIVNLLSHSNQN